MNGVITIGGLVAVVMFTPRLATAQSLSSDNVRSQGNRASGHDHGTAHAHIQRTVHAGEETHGETDLDHHPSHGCR